MNITQLEKEILNALRINSKVYWNTDSELDPNKEFKELIKFVRGLFKEHREGSWKELNTEI